MEQDFGRHAEDELGKNVEHKFAQYEVSKTRSKSIKSIKIGSRKMEENYDQHT